MGKGLLNYILKEKGNSHPKHVKGQISLKLIFYILIIVALIYFGEKFVPVYYRAYIGARGACKAALENYKKYGYDYTLLRFREKLDEIGIPKEKRKTSIQVKEDTVTVAISYEQKVNYLVKYEKNFDFYFDCQGEAKRPIF